MNINDFRYVLAIAKHKHFGNAAKECHISQPALSSQVKKLEETLGVALFERDNKHVYITDIGKILLPQVEAIIGNVEKLKLMAEQSHDPFAGNLHIGIIPTVAPYLLPHVILKLHEQFPKFHWHLREDKTEIILDYLYHGELDAIILAAPIANAGLESTHLYEEPFVCALPPHHDYTKEDEISASLLKKENVLLLDDGHCLRDQALAVCDRVGARENAAYRATSLETLRYMVSAGAGVTLLPLLAAVTDSATSSLVCIKPFTKPVPVREIIMVWRHTHPRHNSFLAIADVIRNNVQTILEENQY